MAKPNWEPRLSEVLGHKTVEIELKSERTGNNYKTDVIPRLQVLSTGSVESLDDGNFRYAIVDSSVGLEYEIKVNKKIDVRFGMMLEFSNVRGGATSRGGWYSADDVVVVQRKQNA